MKDNYESQQLLWKPSDQLEHDIQSIQRMIPSQETNYLTNNMHNFAARFIPHFPKIFIKNLTKEKDIVVDPMMGSGTTLIEAAISNRRGIGIDIDPIGYLISKVATTTIEQNKLRNTVRNLIKRISNSFSHGWKEVKLPSEKEYPNHSLWFRPETLKQLIFIRENINGLKNQDIKNLALLALSTIVRDVSNADPRDIFPERDKNMLVRPQQNVLEKFSKAISQIQEKVIAFSKLINYEKRVDVYLGDSRKIDLSKNSVDLVFTSPPYSYAIDYARVNQLSILLFWMINDKLREYRREYIGTDRVSLTSNVGDYDYFSFAKEEIEGVLSKDKKCGLVLYKYFHDMVRVTHECYRILKNGKYLVYVIGNSTIKGTHFSTENIFTNFCKEIGFKFEKKFSRPYYSYRMSTKRNIQSNKIKEDIFLIFKK
ncbi:MAG: hypothetical protein HQ555_08655 [Candidatus Aminicenantes bacterium]|nr:hypothetical protein [Candidatus Aminicenantes bacterium]